MTEFFPGFDSRRIVTSGTDINLVTGGNGPPLPKSVRSDALVMYAAIIL
jgi:hypothetical protein